MSGRQVLVDALNQFEQHPSGHWTLTGDAGEVVAALRSALTAPVGSMENPIDLPPTISDSALSGKASIPDKPERALSTEEFIELAFPRPVVDVAQLRERRKQRQKTRNALTQSTPEPEQEALESLEYWLKTGTASSSDRCAMEQAARTVAAAYRAALHKVPQAPAEEAKP